MTSLKIDRAMDLHQFVQSALGTSWDLTKIISDTPGYLAIEVQAANGLTELEIRLHSTPDEPDAFVFYVLSINRFFDTRQTDSLSASIQKTLTSKYHGPLLYRNQAPGKAKEPTPQQTDDLKFIKEQLDRLLTVNEKLSKVVNSQDQRIKVLEDIVIARHRSDIASDDFIDRLESIFNWGY